MGTSKNFKQWCHDLKAVPDIHEQLKRIFEKTKDSILKERQTFLEVVLLIAQLDRNNAAVNLGFSSRAAMAKALGLTENMYWKRAQVGRVVEFFPEVWDMLVKGETHLSHVALVAPKITSANKGVILPALKQKSERELKAFLSTVNRDGSILAKEPEIELRLTFTESQLKRLERAREVLSARGQVPSQEEVLLRAVEDLLEKRDPVRKAERAAKRQQVKEVNAKGKFVQKEDENDSATSAKKGFDVGGDIGPTSTPFSLKKDGVYIHAKPAENGRSPSSQKEICNQRGRRQAIPAAVRHELLRRAGGQCMYLAPDGSRCGARRMLEIDHRVPHSLGGSDDISNLRVLCREHNMGAAIEVFGKEFMAEYLTARFR